MFCLQTYKAIRIDRSPTCVLILSSSGVYKLIFYLTIVNKIVHHSLLVGTTVICTIISECGSNAYFREIGE